MLQRLLLISKNLFFVQNKSDTPCSYLQDNQESTVMYVGVLVRSYHRFTSKTDKMKSLRLLPLLLILNTWKSNAQLSGHISNGSTAIGFHAGFVALKHKNNAFEIGQKHGPYFGFSGIDIAHTNYDSWTFRYNLEMKWTMDLFHKGVEFFKGTALDARVDFTGFTWHKLGVNVFSTDNFCVGIGGSFSDYIVDIPIFANENGDFFEGQRWQEPSGWNWTAGPCLFLDYGIGDFAFNFIGSYDLTYFTPKITQDYEDLTVQIDGYEKPHFMYFDFAVNHESGVYMSFNRTLMIDNGLLENNVSRGEFKFGWRWWI